MTIKTPSPKPLWSLAELTTVIGAELDGTLDCTISGVSIDTRTLQPGDLFVALTDARDGHDFIASATKSGAAASLVNKTYTRSPGDGALLRVDDPLRALEDLGRIARFRTDAHVIAVTGSVGKTSTKEMFRACLSALGRTHASEKSYNNHWGVPLTLARMPHATEYGIFEIGMSNAGEIAPLTRMVAPDIAIITTVEPVHLAQFASVEAIADAKAEIMLGLRRGGVLILNQDNPHTPRIRTRADAFGLNVRTFGKAADADVRATSLTPDADGTDITIDIAGHQHRFRVGAPGVHVAKNALAVAAALHVLAGVGDLDIDNALSALATMSAPTGRGARERITVTGGEILLIDESYNANPASMRAALSVLATVPRADWPRRIAVLGDMRELGSTADELHRGLADAVKASGADQVFLCGEHMRALQAVLGDKAPTTHEATSLDLIPALKSALKPGDVVMIKGSLGTNMAPIVKSVRNI